jgi:DNA-directed RNA polymerase subunit RPC12/RpoP
MNETPVRIKTGIVCKYCGWDDSREFDMRGHFEYVCPKCARKWIKLKADPVACDVNGYCKTCD